MKNLIITILLITILLAMASFSAFAERDYFTYGNPGMIIEVGGNPSAGNVNHSLSVEFETGICDVYRLCYNPYFVAISDTQGIGTDVVFKSFKRWRDNLKLSAGPVYIEDETRLHAGVGITLYRSMNYGFTASYDYYDLDNATSVFSLGVQFR